MSLDKLIKVFNTWRRLPYNTYVDIAVVGSFDLDEERFLIGRVPGSRVLICREELTITRWSEAATVPTYGRPSIFTLWRYLP
ncbi:hypothetical protein NVP1032O_13 [Vibrio phage 1.032.O._10N.261.54.F5]|nr:hypothetical protein NVP1032O_13 [Vibrio phage 1.032.O._10N.261.54.F5]